MAENSSLKELCDWLRNAMSCRRSRPSIGPSFVGRSLRDLASPLLQDCKMGQGKVQSGLIDYKVWSDPVGALVLW